MTIHQDVDLYATILSPGKGISHPLRPHRHAWVQVARGAVTLNGAHALHAGDGAALSVEPAVEIAATEPAEVLVFDLS